MRLQRLWVRAFALTLGSALLTPAALPSLASAATDPGEKRAEVRRKRAQTAAQLDALKADKSQIADALSALDDNLGEQQALTDRAVRAEAEASQVAATARQAEEDKQSEIAQLEAETRNFALGMYMGHTSSGVAVFLPGQDPSAAIYRGALSELALGGAASSLDALDTARQDLAGDRARAERARKQAAHRRDHAVQQSHQLAQAMTLAGRKQAELDDRVDQNLAEAGSLATIDARLSKEITARESAIAAELRKSRQRELARAVSNQRLGAAMRTGRRATTRPAILPAEGNLVTVRGIKVHASIAGALSRLIAAAAADGFSLGGAGYRSAAAQIAVRRNNCGPSYYDIWQKPASQCNPPAARPGTSMHERGLAIDFTCNGSLISSYGSACYAWLKANAPGFGFRNRPGEAWHWSPNGN